MWGPESPGSLVCRGVWPLVGVPPCLRPSLPAHSAVPHRSPLPTTRAQTLTPRGLPGSSCSGSPALEPGTPATDSGSSPAPVPPGGTDVRTAPGPAAPRPPSCRLPSRHHVLRAAASRAPFRCHDSPALVSPGPRDALVFCLSLHRSPSTWLLLYSQTRLRDSLLLEINRVTPGIREDDRQEGTGRPRPFSLQLQADAWFLLHPPPGPRLPCLAPPSTRYRLTESIRSSTNSVFISENSCSQRCEDLFKPRE